MKLSIGTVGPELVVNSLRKCVLAIFRYGDRDKLLAGSFGNGARGAPIYWSKTMPDLPTNERELKNTRHEVRNLQVMQMRPDQSAEKLALLRDLKMAARAEVQQNRSGCQ